MSEEDRQMIVEDLRNKFPHKDGAEIEEIGDKQVRLAEILFEMLYPKNR